MDRLGPEESCDRFDQLTAYEAGPAGVHDIEFGCGIGINASEVENGDRRGRPEAGHERRGRSTLRAAIPGRGSRPDSGVAVR